MDRFGYFHYGLGNCLPAIVIPSMTLPAAVDPGALGECAMSDAVPPVPQTPDNLKSPRVAWAIYCSGNCGAHVGIGRTPMSELTEEAAGEMRGKLYKYAEAVGWKVGCFVFTTAYGWFCPTCTANLNFLPAVPTPHKPQDPASNTEEAT